MEPIANFTAPTHGYIADYTNEELGKILVPTTYILDRDPLSNAAIIAYMDEAGSVTRICDTIAHIQKIRNKIVKDGYIMMNISLMYPRSMFTKEDDE